MAKEFGQGDEAHNLSQREFIVYTVITQTKVTTKDKELFAPMPIARIDNEIVRGLFMGEIASLTERYRERFDQLEDDFDKPAQLWQSFSYLMGKAVNSIEDNHELAGTCDFERRRITPYA